MPGTTNEFGRLLKSWRRARGRSQLNLALDAECSSRHLSFIENGRSRPSREMVLRLADALEIPLRDRNSLLNAAGYADLYRRSQLDDRVLEPALNALRFMLERHEPYPAFVVDRLWNLLLANDASQALIAAFPIGTADPAVTTNLCRLVLHPDGLRPHVVNWSEVVEALIVRARREAGTAFGDDPLKILLAEVETYPGVKELVPRLDVVHQLDPVVPLVLDLAGERLRFYTMIATFGTPQDVTLQEIRLETLAPADAATDRFARSLGTRGTERVAVGS